MSSCNWMPIHNDRPQPCRNGPPSSGNTRALGLRRPRRPDGNLHHESWTTRPATAHPPFLSLMTGK
eukprot:817355-Karenia_brevis.AAC.1